MPERPGDRGLGMGLTLFGAIIAAQSSLTLLGPLAESWHCDPCANLIFKLFLVAGPIAGLTGALIGSSALAPQERENLWFVALFGLVFSAAWPWVWLFTGLGAPGSGWPGVIVGVVGMGLAFWGETLKG